MLRSKTGFTLVEVMLCLAVAGILLCVAGPACADLVQRSHAAAARAALLGSITQAVEHAALTGTDVVPLRSRTRKSVASPWWRIEPFTTLPVSW